MKGPSEGKQKLDLIVKNTFKKNFQYAIKSYWLKVDDDHFKNDFISWIQRSIDRSIEIFEGQWEREKK